jgi:hypothetical protein
MDIEFHYHINYLIAAVAGFSSKEAYKIAYSAQYLDDNSEAYTIIGQGARQDTNLVTQSYDPMIKAKDIIEIFPIFHFIPGNDLITSSGLRRDGSGRYMSCLPNNRLARDNLIQALKSQNLYWIGIASHSFVDTWAHQNFTGLKDSYNSLHQKQEAKIFKLPGSIGHLEVLALPDTPNTVWYDFRLKDMKIDNNKRILEAAKELFKIYIKYAGDLLTAKPTSPKKVFLGFIRKLKGILYNDKKVLMEIDFFQEKNKSSQIMMQLLGLKKQQRLECYKRIAQRDGIEFLDYNKKTWLEAAVTKENNLAANDATIRNFPLEALADSGKDSYLKLDGNESFQKTIASLMGFYKEVFFWKGIKEESDWYLFQEAAKKQKSYLLDRIIKIAKKDLDKMQRANL